MPAVAGAQCGVRVVQIPIQAGLELFVDYNNSNRFKQMEKISCFGGQRPSESIRFLINRNLDKLVNIAINDATQFQSTSQSKAMSLDQLKYTLLIAEENIQGHTETILKALVKISGSSSEIPACQQRMNHIVTILGHFVASSYYVPIVTNILGQQEFKTSNKNTIVILNIFAQMISSTKGLQQHTKTFVGLLTQYQKMFYDVDEGLLAIFDISSILLRKITDMPIELLHIIFQIAINVQATRSISEQKRKETPQVFELLAKRGGFASVAELNASEIGPILNTMIKSKEYTQWNKTSKNRFKFDMIVRNCYSEVSRFLQQILIIFEYLMNPDSDIEIRMDVLVLIEYILTVAELRESLAPLSEQLLKKVLLLSIRWKVGKPQIKIRKAGVINIINLIERGIISDVQLLECFKDMLPHLKNCMNDDWGPDLRLASCQLLEKYLLATKQKIGDDQLKQLYPMMLQRLDDSQNPIRLKITAAINVFFSCQSIRWSDTTFDYVINAIFVHFDDSSEQIQSAIYNNLRQAAIVKPKMVLKQAKVNVGRMKYKENCRDLVEYCEERISEFDQE